MKKNSLRKLIPRAIHPLFESKRIQPGAAPGTLLAHPDRPQPEIDIFAYCKPGRVEKKLDSPDDIRAYISGDEPIWINVNGLGNSETIRDIGELFKLHSLALEDVLNIPQRPKVDTFDNNIAFFIARMPCQTTTSRIILEQVSIFWGQNFVLTIQERPGDVFEPIRQRLRHGRGKLARPSPDYLAYTLLDSIIDSYFPLLERHGESLANIEAHILAGQNGDSVADIYHTKRELLVIRRAMWPLRDAVQSLYREPGELLSDDTRLHLRDCIDHCNHIIDLLENYREISSSMLDLYLSMTSQRMNEIMKVLTIIATIFIPLTFIAGIYGMNFDPEISPWNMPELQWAYGYPAVMALMFILSMAMLLFFRKKGWLGGQEALRNLDDDDFRPE